MTLQVIIFDFDGTLVKSLDTVIAISNRLAPEFGYQPSSPEEIYQLRQLTTQEVIKQVGVSWYKLPFLMRRLRQEMNDEIHRLELVDGIKEVLILLKEKGYRLGIITSNAQENVKSCLQHHQLDQWFDFVESELNLFGKSRVIKRVIEKYGFTQEEVIYVGDEVRDIEAAKKIPIKAMAVAWGFHSRDILFQCDPDFLIAQPIELIEVVEKIKGNCLEKPIFPSSL